MVSVPRDSCWICGRGRSDGPFELAEVVAATEFGGAALIAGLIGAEVGLAAATTRPLD